MATPVGHALIGYAVYRGTASTQREDKRTLLWLCLLLAIVPDFDFVPGIFLGQPALYHQGISHSLGMAFVVSLGLALVYSLKRSTFWRDWGTFFLAYASHLIVDMFGPDERPPYGIPLFWPISGRHYLASATIFWGVHHVGRTSGSTGEWILGILTPYNLGATSIEVLMMLPVILLVRMVRPRTATCNSKKVRMRPEPWRFS